MAKKKNYKFKGVGLTRKQTNNGKKKFKSYVEKHSVESFSDLQLLEELIYREIQVEEIKEKIKQLQSSDTVKEKGLIPKNLSKALDDNLENIISLKEKLGLFKDKKDESFFEKFEMIKTKFDKWLEENQASRTAICPHCSKTIMLKVNMEHWKTLKHPYFKDRMLYNKHLWKLWKDGIIKVEDVAKTLNCSVDYINQIDSKIEGPKNDRKN